MSNNMRATLGTLFILVIAFCAIFIVDKKTRGLGWADVTESNLYSLTSGTRSILARLDQPLTVKLFYAHEAATRSGHDFLIEFNNHYYYVRDLLRAYERQAGGKLKLVELDPRPFSDAEEEADRLQMQRYGISEREGFYFGLAVLSETGGRQTVPFLHPQEQELLEYKISEAIDLTGRTKKTKLGVLSSLSITGGGMSDYMRQMMAMQGRQSEQPWAICEQLRKQYDITDVAADVDAIPAEVDFLLVVHPKDLPEKTLYAIDQFVVKGGKAMFCVDPHCFLGDRPPPQNNMFGGQPPQKQSSSLEKLLNAWGVSVADGKFIGDLSYAPRMAMGGPDTIRVVPLTDFQSAAFNPNEATTSGLKTVRTMFAGIIRKVDAAGTDMVPLIQTTQEGNEWAAQTWDLSGPMGPNFQGLSSKFEKGVQRLAVAARVTGKFKSAFEAKPKAEGENGEKKPEDPPKDGEKKDEPTDHVKEAAQPGTLFVVADVDFLTDQGAYQRSFFGLSPANSNSDFVFNCLEQLAGSTELMDIRSRGTFRRPFTVVTEIEEQADLRTRDQVARINADIQKFETELQTMNSQATEANVGLLQAEAIDKQRKLEAEIRSKRREVRNLQEEKLEAVKATGSWWKNLTRIYVPGLVLLVGIVLAVRRHNIRKVTVLGGAS